jgi:hypothetical protein
MALYGIDIAVWSSDGVVSDPRWKYAEFVGAYTVIYLALRVASCPCCRRQTAKADDKSLLIVLQIYLDSLLGLFWLVLFGIFGYLYIHQSNPNNDPSITRMKQAVWVDLGGMLAVGLSFVVDSIRYIDW